MMSDGSGGFVARPVEHVSSGCKSPVQEAKATRVPASCRCHLRDGEFHTREQVSPSGSVTPGRQVVVAWISQGFSIASAV
jgi:hypothetical protein